MVHKGTNPATRKRLQCVPDVHVHAARMNIPQIFHQGTKIPARNSFGSSSTFSPLPRKKIHGTTAMTSKAIGESKVPSHETKKEKSEHSYKDP